MRFTDEENEILLCGFVLGVWFTGWLVFIVELIKEAV